MGVIIVLDVLIIHDAGCVFNEITDNKYSKNKSLKDCIYPSKVHELPSPNDNDWHGPTKYKWKKLCYNISLDKNGIEVFTTAQLNAMRKKIRNNVFFDQPLISAKK